MAPSTLDPASPQAQEISELWWFMLVAATIAVAVVVLLTVIVVVRPGDGRLHRLTRRLGGRWLIVLGGVVVPVGVLSALFALTLDTLLKTAPANARSRLTIEVTGRQWFWDVRYPGTGAITANEIHVPVGVPVTVRVRTGDVNHSFWVPQLNRKIDLIPGQDNRVTFTAGRPGYFRGQCAEYCGTQHAHMGFAVVAEPPERFEAWLRRQAAPALVARDERVAEGRRVFAANGCAACHRIRGTAADGAVGPDLTHLADRKEIAAGTLPNTRGDLAGWIVDPQGIKPGNKMPGVRLDGRELQALLDYLQALR